MSLPFDAASFDRILCQFGVMFFPDKRAAAAEARRVLRPGGVYQFNAWGPLSDNAFARIAHETIATFFPSDPPQFYMTPFGYHDETQIRADLTAAGFARVSIDTVDKPALSVSAADLAIGLVRGNPVIGTIQERGTVDAATVEAAVATALTRVGGAKPFRSMLRARVVTTRA
jgi:SAM-dependent methyltransferase